MINRQRVFQSFPDEVEVAPDGLVTLRQRLWGEFSQAMDLRDFPLDRHRFSTRFSATGFTPDEVVFVQTDEAPSQVSRDRTLPDWIITDQYSEAYAFMPMPELEGELPGFAFHFEAHRDTDYYVFKVILPLLLLVAMSWLAFWINIEESSTQVSVSITTILTLIAYRFAIGSTQPTVSYLTRMDMLILGSTLLTFLALMMVVFIQIMRRNDRLDAALKVQHWCRVVFPLGLGVGVLQSLIL